MLSRPFALVIDTETSGLNVRHDRVLEFAAVLTDGEHKVLGQYETLIAPPEGDLERLVLPKESTLTLDLLRGAETFTQVAPTILSLITIADVWVGYGLTFDVGFLRSEFSRLGVSLPQRPEHDVLRNFPKLTLQKACASAGLAFPANYVWHRAFADCVATWRLYRKIRTFGHEGDDRYIGGEGEDDRRTFGLRLS